LMFYKKRRKKPEICPSQEFNHAVGFARDVIESEQSDKDKIIILDFMMDVIREDLKTDLLSHIFYNEAHFDEEFHCPLPVFYLDAEGQECLIPKLGKTTIDLSETCVLVLPWDRERIKNQVKNIYHNDFIYHPSNHKGYYFPYLGLCHVYNGRHSISAGIIHKKKGTFEVVAYDITAAFPHLHTDGCNWFNSHNNKKRYELTDFRIGILYELSKMKYNLEKPVCKNIL
jgi:hypothetical protein